MDLTGYTLISTSHHRVYKHDDTGRILKVARDDTDASNREIYTDYMVNSELGRDVVFHPRSPGTPSSFDMRNYGTEMPQPTPRLFSHSLDELHRVWSRIQSDPLISDSPDEYMDLTTEKVERRLFDVPSLRIRALAWLDEATPAFYDAYTEPLGLCHNDPRNTNWVSENGKDYMLIDWERPLIGPPFIDLAALYHTYTVRERHDLTRLVLERVEDMEKFRAFFLVKAVLSLTWRYGYNPSHIPGRLDLIDRTLRKLH